LQPAGKISGDRESERLSNAMRSAFITLSHHAFHRRLRKRQQIEHEINAKQFTVRTFRLGHFNSMYKPIAIQREKKKV
jgi:hypothetical protein